MRSESEGFVPGSSSLSSSAIEAVLILILVEDVIAALVATGGGVAGSTQPPIMLRPTMLRQAKALRQRVEDEKILIETPRNYSKKYYKDCITPTQKLARYLPKRLKL